MKPIEAFIVDRKLWDDPRHTVESSVSQIWAAWAFETAAYMSVNPEATDEQKQAAAVFRATNPEQLNEALQGNSQLPALDTPLLLSAPKSMRSVQFYDAELGAKIHSMSAPPLPPTEKNTGEENQPATRHLTPKERQLARFHKERKAARLLYYVKYDPEPDPDLPFALPPTEYRSYGTLLHERLEAYRQRQERQTQAAQFMPRVSIEFVTRAYLDDYRRPLHAWPAEQERKGCCNGKACVVHWLAQHGEQVRFDLYF